MTTPKTFNHSGFNGRIGVAREDITPPIGIFARNWGAAKHDTAKGIHRPLTLTALTLQDAESGKPLVFVDSDLGWFAGRQFTATIFERLRKDLGVEAPQLIFGLSHSHAGPPMSTPEPTWQGGELLAPFVDKVCQQTVAAVQRALATARPALIEWHSGRCALATNRDLRDGKRVVCGYNPEIKADDTVVVGRVSDSSGKLIATLVNYACHPTTLAWQNELISPDYVGAMRETMQQQTGVPALFMQGASGELSPRYQYVGETEAADSHGRQLAYAALSTLEDMEPAGQALVYAGLVESGAPLATWKRERRELSAALKGTMCLAHLPLKKMPSVAEIKRQYAECTDRTIAERLRRKLHVRESVGDGETYGMELYCWGVGDAVVIGCLAEAYSQLQMKLRARFPNNTIVWMNLINGTIGYLAPAPLYDEDIYQVWQSPFERGSLEILEATAIKLIQEVLGKQ